MYKIGCFLYYVKVYIHLCGCSYSLMNKVYIINGKIKLLKCNLYEDLTLVITGCISFRHLNEYN